MTAQVSRRLMADRRLRDDTAVYTVSVTERGMVEINAEDLEYPAEKFFLEPGRKLRSALEARGWYIIVGGPALPRGQFRVVRR